MKKMLSTMGVAKACTMCEVIVKENAWLRSRFKFVVGVGFEPWKP